MNGNLIPLNERTKEKQREIAAMGGKASGEARRLKKSMKLALKEIMEEEVKDQEGKGTGKTYQDLVNLGLLRGAMNGNAQNYKVIAEMLGELNGDSNDDTIKEINNNIQNIADLINNPKPNRNDDNV